MISRSKFVPIIISLNYRVCYTRYMNYKEFLQENSPWLLEPGFRFPNIITRKHYVNAVNLDDQLVQIILGARRIGKSSIMKQLINKLLDGNKEVYYFSADNPLLNPEYFYELINIMTKASVGTRVYVFIDEIQDMPGWQRVVKHFYDNRDVKFVLTGSSSLVINQDASKLTGRHHIVYAWPLDYEEAKLFKPSITMIDYLRDGSYPEIVLGKIEPARIVDIVESTLYRDLLSLYQIRNPSVLGELIKLLVTKVGTPVGYSNIASDLNIDDQTVSKILNYLVGMRLLVKLPLYSMSAKKKLRNPNKYYFIDSGIVHKYSLNPKVGLLAENTVAIKLERARLAQNSSWGYEVLNGQEVDFRVGMQRYEVSYTHNTGTNQYTSLQR
jgi:uncharacterized protein